MVFGYSLTEPTVRVQEVIGDIAVSEGDFEHFLDRDSCQPFTRFVIHCSGMDSTFCNIVASVVLALAVAYLDLPVFFHK